MHTQYLVGCSRQSDKLDDKLVKMYEAYKDKSDGQAFFYYVQSLFFYQDSMKDCTQTQPLFQGMVHDWFVYYDQDNWWDVYQATYEANEDLIKVQMDSYLKTWDEGTYFNAGMFYGRIWNVLIFYGTVA